MFFSRLNEMKVMSSLFPECLKPDAPSVFRAVMVKALLHIAREGRRSVCVFVVCM